MTIVSVGINDHLYILHCYILGLFLLVFTILHILLILDVFKHLVLVRTILMVIRHADEVSMLARSHAGKNGR